MGFVIYPAQKKNGPTRDYFSKTSVNWTTFGGGAPDGYGPDLIIPFSTQGVMMLNLGSGVVEYSCDGINVHGELSSANASAGMAFDNRVMPLVWFRVQTGSSGPIIVSVQAWSTR